MTSSSNPDAGPDGRSEEIAGGRPPGAEQARDHRGATIGTSAQRVGGFERVTGEPVSYTHLTLPTTPYV